MTLDLDPNGAERKMTEAMDEIREAVAAEPKSELELSREEVAFLKTCGIVELAVRNPSVAEYMAHWETRAEQAEGFARHWHREIEAIGAMLEIGAPEAGEVPRAVQTLLSQAAVGRPLEAAAQVVLSHLAGMSGLDGLLRMIAREIQALGAEKSEP